MKEKTTKVEKNTTAEVKNEKVRVEVNLLNVRADATLESSVIAIANEGEILEVTGKPKNGFYAVTKDGLNGFVKAEFVVVVEE